MRTIAGISTDFPSAPKVQLLRLVQKSRRTQVQGYGKVSCISLSEHRSRALVSISQKTISNGVVYEVPADLKKHLHASQKRYQRGRILRRSVCSEWICWIEAAKKAETKPPHRVGLFKLKGWKTTPVCRTGCNHRYIQRWSTVHRPPSKWITKPCAVSAELLQQLLIHLAGLP
jgi:hypothetical protein